MTPVLPALAMAAAAAGTFAASGGLAHARLPRSAGEARARLARACERCASTPLLDALLRSGTVRVLAAALWRRLAGRGVAPSEAACGMAVVASVPAAALAGSLWAGSPAVAPVLAACWAVLLRSCASALSRRASRELADEMPGVLRMLASALGSGKTLAQAVEYVGANARGAAGDEFARMGLELRFGEPVRSALEGLARRLEAPGVRMLVTSLAISQRTGSPLDAMLGRTARMVEAREELRRSLEVKTAQARLSIRIVCLMPVVMLGLLSLLSVDFQRGLATPAGTACVACALAMDALALLVVRRLLRGVM